MTTLAMLPNLLLMAPLLVTIGQSLLLPRTTVVPTTSADRRVFSSLDDSGSSELNQQRPHRPTDLKWNRQKLQANNVDAKVHEQLEDIYWKAVGSHETVSLLSLPTAVATDDVESLRPELQQVRRFLLDSDSTLDMAHAGRFGVTNNLSMHPNLVFSMESPQAYFRDVILHPCGLTPAVATTKGASTRDKSVVLFCPGLHSTLSQATQQQNYLSQVLGIDNIALLHVGTHAGAGKDDQPIVSVPTETVLKLQSAGLLETLQQSPLPSSNRQSYQISPKDTDLLRSVVSWRTTTANIQNKATQDDDPLVSTLIKLIDVAVESVLQQKPTNNNQQQPQELVLIAYSETTKAISTAIHIWKQRATSKIISPSNRLRCFGLDLYQAEGFLCQAITIVTIAGLCSSFPDGPAYIHVSMLDDKLATKYGCTPTSSQHDVKDVVYLQALSPYNNADDAHNPQACVIQFLSLVMRINGIQSFRQLYEAGCKPTPRLDIAPKLFALDYNGNNAGYLSLPCDDLLTSMIQATSGCRWLQNEDRIEVDNQDYEDILPDAVEAEATIAEHFGYGVYEEIVEACRG